MRWTVTLLGLLLASAALLTACTSGSPVPTGGTSTTSAPTTWSTNQLQPSATASATPATTPATPSTSVPAGGASVVPPAPSTLRRVTPTGSGQGGQATLTTAPENVTTAPETPPAAPATLTPVPATPTAAPATTAVASPSRTPARTVAPRGGVGTGGGSTAVDAGPLMVGAGVALLLVAGLVVVVSALRRGPAPGRP